MYAEKSNTVTYVKAIGITLMVMAHALSMGCIGWNAIYAFHMPLFFLMSGYCFKEKYLSDAKQFMLRKIKGIYVPFVLFALPFLALHNVFCSWYFYEPDWLYGWKDFAWNAGRIVTRMSMNEGLLGTFWFLKELFWGSLFFYAAMRIAKGRVVPVVLGMLALSELMCVFGLRIPYFNITSDTLFAAFFISCGYLWKVKSERIKELGNGWKWLSCIIGIGALVAELIWSPQIGMLGNTPLSLIYYTIPAIGMTMMLFYGCCWMESILPDAISRVVQFVGDHSLSIMALHFTAFKLVSLVLIKAHHLPIERLTEFPVVRECANGGAILLYSFVGVCAPLMCAWIWQRGTECLKALKGEGIKE